MPCCGKMSSSTIAQNYAKRLTDRQIEMHTANRQMYQVAKRTINGFSGMDFLPEAINFNKAIDMDKLVVDVHFDKPDDDLFKCQVKLKFLNKLSDDTHELNVEAKNIQYLDFDEDGTITYQKGESKLQFKLDLNKLDSVFKKARGDKTGKTVFKDQKEELEYIQGCLVKLQLKIKKAEAAAREAEAAAREAEAAARKAEAAARLKKEQAEAAEKKRRKKANAAVRLANIEKAKNARLVKQLQDEIGQLRAEETGLKVQLLDTNQLLRLTDGELNDDFVEMTEGDRKQDYHDRKELTTFKENLEKQISENLKKVAGNKRQIKELEQPEKGEPVNETHRRLLKSMML